MKKIKLSKNKYALVDNEDFQTLNKYKWYVSSRWTNTSMYVAYRIENNKCIMMHRQIMNIADKKIQVDHVNRNPLDNRKNNLRLCTNAQNQYNTVVRKDNLLGVKGVKICGNKFRARITINKKLIHLGLFDTIEDASKAYAKNAKKYFGEFARVK